uniref:Uncharacterized protein n=1 Tax=Kalanchoe fedtschenkoi TaxID=63787 RepID=A0A7N0U5N4_KALFE
MQLTRMEGGGAEGGLIGAGELVDQHLVPGVLDGFDESRSGSENLDAASGDDQSIMRGEGRAPKRKKYHRHTPQQIQELEAFYKECPHPDEKQRLELSRRLNLETRQVKFWFQNRRTQMKTQIERHENMLLKKENDKLRFEQAAMKNALRNPLCTSCGGPVVSPELPFDEQTLKSENARLRDELTRICLLTEKFLGRPISSIASSLTQRSTTSTLDFSLGNIGFQGLNSMDHALSSGLDMSLLGSAVSLPEAPVDKSFIVQLAVTAMDELMKMAAVNTSLWSSSSDGVKEVLNFEEYLATFPPTIGPKPNNFVLDASRDTGLVCLNSLALVETFMDLNQWVSVFPSLVARASTTTVISPGLDGSWNGTLQLMQAELQVLSPLVPLRQVKFLRFCKKHEEGKWAVVDLSIDAVHEGSVALSPFSLCRRLPSGCVIQEMPDGFSKVTWIEHTQYDENVVHPLYRRLLGSGMGFGAKRWLASLQRHCEGLAALMASGEPVENPSGMTASGRKSMFKLARRMSDNFCSGVCASLMSKWERLYPGNVGEESVQLMSRKTVDSPGEPSGIVLSATASVWMPVARQRLFDFLRDKRYRSDWDILSNGGPIQEVVRISKGPDPGNCVSLLRCDTASPSQEMLILQETWTDAASSLIVYAPVDTPAIQSVLGGGDSTYVALLPSGFALYPDPDPAQTGNPAAGCLLTAGFQILVNELPTAKLTVDSVTTVEHLIHCTIEKIHQALDCAAPASRSQNPVPHE